MIEHRTATVAVVGAGPAGLMAAEVAARAGLAVAVYDRMPSPGRKLLLAGRGGLNLTHSEAPPAFVARYGAAAAHLTAALERFGPSALRDWCADLGIETFVGSSGRVFPTGFKTSPLLRAWLWRLDAAGVGFRLRHRWRGWDGAGRLTFETPDGPTAVAADATIFALGGASWPQLGPDGLWAQSFAAAGLDVVPLRPANCGFIAGWSDLFRDRFEGQPLKAVRLAFDGETARGDAMITRSGLEGGAVYALSGALREAIARDGSARLEIALRPDMVEETIAGRLAKRRPKETLSNALRRTLNLAPVAMALLREAELPPGATLSNLEPATLARLVNAVPVRLSAAMQIARAISTAGGIPFAALDPELMLRGRPGCFVAGEMLDWEAPTGGYLLQGCFATGVVAGEAAAKWLRHPAKVEADADASIMV